MTCWSSTLGGGGGGGEMVTNLIVVCTKATGGMSAVPQTVCHHPLQHAHWGGGGGKGRSLQVWEEEEVILLRVMPSLQTCYLLVDIF